MKRRVLLSISMLLAGVCALPVASAQATYPNRLVHLIVPAPPGGPLDNIARLLSDALGKDFGQPVVVVNRPGAGGVIGAAELARATPDGYTLGLGNADSLITGPILVPTAGYDPTRDFDLLSQVAYGRQTLVVHPDVKATTLPELMELARKEPGSVNFASYGPGSRPELIFADLADDSGVEFMSVPYRGFSPALQDLLANRVQVGLVPTSLAAEFQAKNMLRPIVVLGQDRDRSFLQDVTTSAEQGVHRPIMDTHMWVMLFAPRGLPPEVTARIDQAMEKLLADEEFSKRILSAGQYAMPGHAGETLAREFADEHTLITGIMGKLSNISK